MGKEMKRILVADDHPDTAASFAALLRCYGYEAFTAANGRIALDLAASVQPEAMLLDISMPGMNGPELCRRIRREAWGKKAVIISITGWADAGHRNAAIDAGCDFVLVKPVDWEAVRALLEAHVNVPELAGVSTGLAP